MQTSSVRLCFQLRTALGVRCKLEFGQRGEKVFYCSVPVKADPKVLAVRDKLLYCEYLDREIVTMGYVKRQRLQQARAKLDAKAKFERMAYQPVFSVTLNDRLQEKGMADSSEETVENYAREEEAKIRKPVHMPYAMLDSYETAASTLDDEIEDDEYEGPSTSMVNEKYKVLSDRYLEVKRTGDFGDCVDREKRPDCIDRSDLELILEKMRAGSSEDLTRSGGELSKVPWTWMSDYEQFDDTLLGAAWYNSHGTPDPQARVSSVPCGGCGALLHSKDPAIPGYLPSELFSQKQDKDLKSMICQRCHFLKFYNTALEVKVSAEDYPKVLSAIKRRKCAIILMVDLTDFPCSIWPGLRSIMHPFTPVFLVGNKVDLLPRDCPRFLENVRQLLLDTVVEVTGVNRANVTHVQLTSAKTGYGIEQLINKLQFKWRFKGDVYLVGCTNVGKSSLFNALLNSDYCKVQAIDLVQRATVSAWPGTTLNVLKFPILNPSGKKLLLRTERLKNEVFYRREEAKYRDYLFKETKNIELASLEDHVGRTFTGNTADEERFDPFSEKSAEFMPRQHVFDQSSPEYEQSRWCYDTPGTIHADQTLDLLTTDELLAAVPQRIISPRTFVFRPGQTVFVGGMGRMDYLVGDYFIRCTLFASNELPVTICYTCDANQLYQQLLETDAFVVPTNDPERLKVWPKLESKELKITGIRNRSAADVVLSSAGWIAITPHENENVALRAWTPQGRGIYLRCPALLGQSVNLRGPKAGGTPMYMSGRQVYVKPTW